MSRKLRKKTAAYLEYNSLREIIDREDEGFIPNRIKITVDCFALVMKFITNFNFHIWITTP